MGSGSNNTNNFIEINGKRYDAISGALLGDVSDAKNTAKTAPASHHAAPHRPRGIDDIVRVSRDTDDKIIDHTVSVPVRHATHTPAQHKKPHAPSRSSTLMRSAVKKPDITPASVIKAKSRTDILAKQPVVTVTPKSSYLSVDKKRHTRAQRIIQNPAISHYGQTRPVIGGQTQLETVENYTDLVAEPQPVSQALLSLNSAPAPVADHGAHHAPAHHTSHSSHLEQAHHKIQHQESQAHHPHIPVQQHAQHAPSPANDIFAQALSAAKTNEEIAAQQHKAARKQRARKARYAILTIAAFVALGGFAVFNSDNLSLTVANYKAGINAKLPSDQPDGYKFGYLDYKPGNVVVNYMSESDSRQFNISQKVSDWDSQALLSNFVKSTDSAYQTYERAGRTIYVLGNNTATWVDSGIWYTVDGNSSLSQSEVMDVVAAM